MQRLIINEGDKFNRLTIVKEVESDGYKRTFECLCKCGNTITAHLTSLRSENTRSCGCFRDEKTVARNKLSIGTKKSKYIKKDETYWNHWEKK